MTAGFARREFGRINNGPLIPAKVVTDRETLPKDLESRLQKAWLQSKQPASGGSHGGSRSERVLEEAVPVASTNGKSSKQMGETQSKGLKRVRSGKDDVGNSRNLTNTLQNLWMRTRSNSTHMRAYDHLPELSSATAASSAVPLVESVRQGPMNGTDYTASRTASDRPEAKKGSQGTGLAGDIFQEVDSHGASAVMEEDFFRGLDGLEDAFLEMQQFLDSAEDLTAAAAVTKDGVTPAEDAAEFQSASVGGLEAEEAYDLLADYFTNEHVAEEASTRGELMSSEILADVSKHPGLSLEVLHAQEPLGKILNECNKKKATLVTTASSRPPNGHFSPSDQGQRANVHQESTLPAMELLIEVAKAIVSDDQSRVVDLLAKLTEVASVYGDAQQRLSAYFLQGLNARMSGDKIVDECQKPCKPSCSEVGTVVEDTSSSINAGENGKSCSQRARHILESFQVVMNASPYLTFGQVAANSAILEAFKGENSVHIMDCGTGFGLQWPALIQALAARPGGPPVVRLTAIEFQQGEGNSPYCLLNVGEKLKRVAKLWGVPFEYHPVFCRLEDLAANILDMRNGEAIAVNFSLRLHQLLDNFRLSASSCEHVLRTFRSLNPKVCTIVEQHTNHNSPFFLARFYEALYYYSSLFESIEEAIPRDLAARRLFEQQVLGRAIVNVVAEGGKGCGKRQELAGRWQELMRTVGFNPRPVSEGMVITVKALLQTYRSSYGLLKEEGCLILTWDDKPLLAMTSWQPNRSS